MKAVLTLSVSILLFQIFTATAQQATTTSRNLNQIKESFYKSLGLSEKDLEEYRIESRRHHEENENGTDGLLAQFHRWEWLMRTRVDATGNLPDPTIAAKEFMKYKLLICQFKSFF